MKLPRPSANINEYRRIMMSGFERYPDRLNNYNKIQDLCESGYGEILDCMPIKMDYEVSNACNFRCKMCLLSDPQSCTSPKIMRYDDFKKSVEQQWGLIEVKLQGLGEPLLNHDFFKMVDECVKRDIWVRTVTNGSVLHVNDNYKKMIEKKIGEIQVSIDGAKKETFEYIREGSDFEQVVANVKMMNEYAAQNGREWSTSCWMLVQNDNFEEMEDVLDLAEYMGFTRMVYSISVGDFGGIGNWKEINGKKNVGDRFTEAIGWNLVEKGKRKGIDVSFWDVDDKYKYNESRKEICDWLFTRSYISADMRIVPCCEISDPQICDMGKALDFRNEWNNEKFREIRKSHINGNIPQMCRNCYDGI